MGRWGYDRAAEASLGIHKALGPTPRTTNYNSKDNKITTGTDSVLRAEKANTKVKVKSRPIRVV